MYNYNSVDGKIARIDELSSLISKLSKTSEESLTCAEAIAISDYLVGIKQDLERQVAPTIAKRRGVKRYTYHYLAEDIKIQADTGREAELEYAKLRKDPPAGNIELIDNVTGEKDLIMKIDIGTPVNF